MVRTCPIDRKHPKMDGRFDDATHPALYAGGGAPNFLGIGRTSVVGAGKRKSSIVPASGPGHSFRMGLVNRLHQVYPPLYVYTRKCNQ